jgi:carboxyl-terminal processing protease
MTLASAGSSIGTMKIKQRIRDQMFGALVALAAAGARLSSQQPAPVAPVALDTTIELASFDTAWRRVRDSYYDPSMHGLDWNHVRDEFRPLVARAQSRDQVRDAIGRMFAALGDSHFGVIAAEEAPQTDAASSAVDVPGDVGIDLRFIGTDLVVTHVDSASPAARAGIVPGWIVDDIDTTHIATLRRFVDKATTEQDRKRVSLRVVLGGLHRLSGPPGSHVHVVFRDQADRRVERDIVRRPARGTVVHLGALPPMPTWLDQTRIDGPRGCVGVIRFNTWMPTVAPAFDAALDSMRGCHGIVLDLRGNVGGVAAMIMGIAGHFTDHEMVLGVMRMRTGQLRYVANPRRSTSAGVSVEPFSGRLALIVDELSASTTEIFASALQQQGRARVFGDTTAGQALPSVLARLPNGDAILYAVADLTDAGGRRLEGKGVTPDELFPLSRAELFAGRDDALTGALHWIEAEGRTHPGRGGPWALGQERSDILGRRPETVHYASFR